ncbi:MAG: DUF4458 domain-containing protein [Bacteroidales bacterium]
MKMLRHISYLCCLLTLLLSFNSCKDEVVGTTEKYGYLQFRLEKEPQTRAMTNGSKLNYLTDAKKIEITLLFDNNEIRQTLNIMSAAGEGSEYSVRTEKLELRPGSYTFTGYKIYGSKIIDGTAEVLQSGAPDEATRFMVESARLHVQTLALNVQHRGKVSFMLKKDFSQIPNLPDGVTKAGNVQDESLFNYYNVYFVELQMQTATGVRIDTVETRYVKGDECWSTDTLTLNAGNYTLKRSLLMDKNHKVVLVMDPAKKFVVEEAQMKREEFKVTYPANAQAIQDYIALYNIWVKMKGETWYCMDDNAPEGANWVFDNRPVDDWGQQPLVGLHNNGRVQILNLGAFNPKGMVPDEIGQLTALEALYLGTHSDRSRDGDQIERIDMYDLRVKGIDVVANRMQIGKERLALRHRKQNLTDFEKSFENQEERKFSIKTYATEKGEYTNSITGISPEIGKCKALNALFVANGLVTELPDEIGALENLTDVEIFNCPLMQKFPRCFSKLPNLVALNFSLMPKMDPNDLYDGVSELFNSPTAKYLQILYFSETNMDRLPANMEKLVKLGLLDLSYNKIKKLYPLTTKVSPVQVFFDYNQIENLPDDFCNIDDIESFIMVGNKLKVFPNTFNKNKSIYKLKTVDLSDNQLETFAPNFEGVNIESLNLNFNNFGKANKLGGKGTFPAQLSETESIINFLQIGNNHMDTLSYQSIENLSMLVAFDAKGNRLKFMPMEMYTGNFPVMEGLDVSINSFEQFPVNVLNMATLLQLRVQEQTSVDGKRCLKNWPDNIYKHYSLRVLDMSGNDIRMQQGEFPSLLNMLNISDNPNISVTLNESACRRVLEGSMKLYYDKEQDIQGCPQIMK